MRHNKLVNTDAELASFSLTLEPNGESDHGEANKTYIAFYNQQRLHSPLRYLPLAAFEMQRARQAWVN